MASARAASLATRQELATGRPYGERADRAPALHDRLALALWGATICPLLRLRGPAGALRVAVDAAGAHEAALRSLSDTELQALAATMRRRLRREGLAIGPVGACFALVREAADRTLGKRHFDSQVMAGWALLRGRLVEMDTGEGKTLSATLPACTMALAGHPVHIVTVNDYLAQRDAAEMEPLYAFLGLSPGVVLQGMPRAERRQAYARPIVYCSNKELAFDYLRDRVALARRGSRLQLALGRLHGAETADDDLVLRGLHYAIVDEADSVFIDEARTPLILSAASGASDEKELCEQALAVARHLLPGRDYELEQAERRATLTDAGAAQVAALARPLAGVWTSVRAREELTEQALGALHLFRRDEHYVVADGKVHIVDEGTGRIMVDRSWERGLHQLIEVKEGCEPTERRETLARLTYQRLFRRYVRLAGMTGTAREVAREVRSVYGLDVVRIPLHRPSRRSEAPPRVFATRAAKWRDVAEEVARIAAIGRPVLIGTRSVGASEEVSAVLAERGIAHALLNAKQDGAEADIVAGAGQPSRITVATNMAGRGTDIRLGPGVAEAGGLHVILTEYHDSPRVDRQLVGRCARQGDPGSTRAIVSLEDDLYVVNAPRAARLLRRLARAGIAPPPVLAGALRRLAQSAAERRGLHARVATMQADRHIDQALAFSGRPE